MTRIYNQSMFKARRKELRNNPTKAEKLLWELLKGKKLSGYKFRRQYGIGKHIVDFYCAGKKLAIELDGDVHDTAIAEEYDKQREDYIRSFKIKIIRVKNEMIEENIDEAIEMILDALNAN